MQRVLALTHVVHAFQQKLACRHDGLVGSGNVFSRAVFDRFLTLNCPTIVVQKIGSQSRESISLVHLLPILTVTIRGCACSMVVLSKGGTAVSHFTVSQGARAPERHRIFPMTDIINRHMPIHLIAVRSRPAANRAQVRHYKISDAHIILVISGFTYRVYSNAVVGDLDIDRRYRIPQIKLKRSRPGHTDTAVSSFGIFVAAAL